MKQESAPTTGEKIPDECPCIGTTWEPCRECIEKYTEAVEAELFAENWPNPETEQAAHDAACACGGDWARCCDNPANYPADSRHATPATSMNGFEVRL